MLDFSAYVNVTEETYLVCIVYLYEKYNKLLRNNTLNVNVNPRIDTICLINERKRVLVDLKLKKSNLSI